MRPFRNPPRIELGPLSVGLVDTATRAMTHLPRGGRVRGQRPGAITPRALGALGSGGLIAVLTACFVTMTSGFTPSGPTARALVMVLVLVGGASLALLLRAVDRVTSAPILRGDLVGRRARRTVAGIARLAARAERSPHTFCPRQLAALRRAIAATRDPDVAPWIAPNVVGRAELLLARALALHGGPRWIDNGSRRADVCDLLRRAARDLADPAPALADLESVPGARSRRRMTTRRRIEVRNEVRCRGLETSGVWTPVAVAEPDAAEELDLPTPRLARA